MFFRAIFLHAVIFNYVNIIENKLTFVNLFLVRQRKYEKNQVKI